MNTVDYLGDGTGNGPSRSVFAYFNQQREDISHAYYEQFMNTPDMVTTEVHDGWQSYLDTGCTATVLDDTANGIMAIALDATGSDEEGAIQWDASHAPYSVISTNGSEKRISFECRVAVLATTLQTVYVGLCDAGSLGDGLLNDDGSGINDKDFIGFRILEADPDTFDAVYRTAGTEVVLKNKAQDMTTLVYHKFGFYYDGKYIEYFVDGVTVGKVLATATSFPDGVQMAPLFTIKQHEAAAKTLKVDFVKIVTEL